MKLIAKRPRLLQLSITPIASDGAAVARLRQKTMLRLVVTPTTKLYGSR